MRRRPKSRSTSASRLCICVTGVVWCCIVGRLLFVCAQIPHVLDEPPSRLLVGLLAPVEVERPRPYGPGWEAGHGIAPQIRTRVHAWPMVATLAIGVVSAAVTWRMVCAAMVCLRQARAGCPVCAHPVLPSSAMRCPECGETVGVDASARGGPPDMGIRSRWRASGWRAWARAALIVAVGGIALDAIVRSIESVGAIVRFVNGPSNVARARPALGSGAHPQQPEPAPNR